MTSLSTYVLNLDRHPDRLAWMAEQLDGDTSLAAGAIVTSTLMSALTFSVIIGMMG